jgi:hypothetical protein
MTKNAGEKLNVQCDRHRDFKLETTKTTVKVISSMTELSFLNLEKHLIRVVQWKAKTVKQKIIN